MFSLMCSLRKKELRAKRGDKKKDEENHEEKGEKR